MTIQRGVDFFDEWTANVGKVCSDIKEIRERTYRYIVFINPLHTKTVGLFWRVQHVLGLSDYNCHQVHSTLVGRVDYCASSDLPLCKTIMMLLPRELQSTLFVHIS